MATPDVNLLHTQTGDYGRICVFGRFAILQWLKMIEHGSQREGDSITICGFKNLV